MRSKRAFDLPKWGKDSKMICFFFGDITVEELIYIFKKTKFAVDETTCAIIGLKTGKRIFGHKEGVNHLIRHLKKTLVIEDEK